jgi:hypothetical protein
VVKVNRKYKQASLGSSTVKVSDEEVIGRLLGKLDVVLRNFATKTEVHDSINTIYIIKMRGPKRASLKILNVKNF